MRNAYEVDIRLYTKSRKHQALVAPQGDIASPEAQLTLWAQNDREAFEKVKRFLAVLRSGISPDKIDELGNEGIEVTKLSPALKDLDMSPDDSRPVAGGSYLRFAREKYWVISA